MNKTKIEWCDYTWNPITGCWGPMGSAERPNWCPYCYARKIAQRFFPNKFEPTFYKDRLEEPLRLRRPSKIFVCSMGEMFGPWIPIEWIEKIMSIIRVSNHTFFLLTKAPLNLSIFHLDYPNLWVGLTIDGRDSCEKSSFWFFNPNTERRFISFEPLLQEIWDLDAILKHLKPKWIIVGAQTNPKKLPKAEWVEEIIKKAREEKIPIFLKDNLGREEKICEWPDF